MYDISRACGISIGYLVGMCYVCGGGITSKNDIKATKTF